MEFRQNSVRIRVLYFFFLLSSLSASYFACAIREDSNRCPFSFIRRKRDCNVNEAASRSLYPCHPVHTASADHERLLQFADTGVRRCGDTRDLERDGTWRLQRADLDPTSDLAITFVKVHGHPPKIR